MQSVIVLRTLWRHRIIVCIFAVLAVAGGWLVAFGPSPTPKSRAYSVGVATANILVDTPKSQVVEVDPKGSDTLAARANVLANLMVDGEIKAAIAKRVGLPPNALLARAPTSPDSEDPAKKITADSRVYTTSVVLTSDMDLLPIIKVDTQAPTVGQAIKIANGVVAGLGDYLDARAAQETIGDDQRLRERPLGTADGHESPRGTSPKMGVIAGLLIFIALCVALLIMSALVRGWHAAVVAERYPAEAPQPLPIVQPVTPEVRLATPETRAAAEVRTGPQLAPPPPARGSQPRWDSADAPPASATPMEDRSQDWPVEGPRAVGLRRRPLRAQE
jgi:hypothetical protein